MRETDFMIKLYCTAPFTVIQNKIKNMTITDVKPCDLKVIQMYLF